MTLVDVNKKIKNESDWSNSLAVNSRPSVPPSVAWAALLAQAKLAVLDSFIATEANWPGGVQPPGSGSDGRS